MREGSWESFRKHKLEGKETMIKIREIEKAVSSLPAKDLVAFRGWFQKFDATKWDRQFENDARSGKLDRLAHKAMVHLL